MLKVGQSNITKCSFVTIYGTIVESKKRLSFADGLVEIEEIGKSWATTEPFESIALINKSSKEHLTQELIMRLSWSPRDQSRLDVLAARYLPASRDSTPALTIYRLAHTKLIERRASIPIAPAVSFSVMNALWLSSLVLLLVFVGLNNSLNILTQNGGNYSQPWIILNAFEGIPRLVAKLWLIVILLSPWLAGTAVAMGTALTYTLNPVGGITNRDPTVLLEAVGIFTIYAVGGVLSYPAYSKLAFLRNSLKIHLT